MTNTEFINLHSAAALENYAAQHPDFTALCNMLSHVIDKRNKAEILIEFGNLNGDKFSPFSCASYKDPFVTLDYSNNPEYLLTDTAPIVIISKSKDSYDKTRLDFSLLKIESQHESADGIIIKGAYDTIPCRLVVCS